MSYRLFKRTVPLFSFGLLLASGTASHAVIIADSVADFPAADNVTNASKQNINGWRYGYHQDSVAGAGFSYNAGSFIPFPDNQGPGVNASDFWTGSAWDWANAGGLVNPPWTTISATSGHPNAQATGGEQWAIRRYVAEETGAANVSFNLAKAAAGGDGTSVRVFVNGASLPSSSFAIANTDTTGRTWSIHVPTLNKGDFLDVALDHTGATGASDGGDTSFFGMKVDRVSTAASTLIADSIADFPAADNVTSNPKQGTNSWFYGRHNVTANGAYQASDFIPFADNTGPGISATDHWNGSIWDVAAGVAPWSEISATGGHPNGTNNAAAGGNHGESWVIRRYVSEVEGNLVVDSFFAKSNTAAGNNGINGRIFHNGNEVYLQFVAATDGLGFNAATTIFNVKVGDFIDIALDANGVDGSDGSLFNAQIFQLNNVPEPGTAVLGMLAMAGLGLRRRRTA